MRKLRDYFFFLIFSGISVTEVYSQKKIINYDYESNGFDRDYIYFRENFIFKGPSKINGVSYDSVKVTLYKTHPNDENYINKLPTSTFQTTVGVGSLRTVIQKNGKLYLENAKGLMNKRDRALKVNEIRQIATSSNSVNIRDDSSYTNTWKRTSPSIENFSIPVTDHLLYKWTYKIRFDFFGSRTDTTSAITTVSTSTIALSNGSFMASVKASTSQNGVISNTITSTIADASGTMATVHSTITTFSTTIINSRLTPPYVTALTYDPETIQSRFSVTTGFGAVAFLTEKAKKADMEFLNFVAVRFHFDRIFPAFDNPYFLKGSRWSFGFGVVTTTLKYQDKDLIGFGNNSTAKPLVFFSHDFHKLFGVSMGIVGFKQPSPVSTSTNKTFAISPFATINISTEVLGLFSSGKKPVESNKE